MERSASVRSPSRTDDVPAKALVALSPAVASYVEAGDVVGAELLVRQHGRRQLWSCLPLMVRTVN